MGLLFLLFGIAFGFALSRARATDYDTIISMFRLTDLHLVVVMVVAIAVAAAGLAILRRRRAQALIGCSIDIHPKAMQRGILPAGLVFGVGWALTGGWPGAVLTQLGELKTYALFTFGGITAGTYAYGAGQSRGGKSKDV